MSFQDLEKSDQRNIIQGLKYIYQSGMLDEKEIKKRIGVKLKDLAGVINGFPFIEDAKGSNGALAINNCLNEVCNDIKFSALDWDEWFTVSHTSMQESYDRWKNNSKASETR